MPTSGLLWRVFPDVRVHERSRFGFFAGLSALGSAAQTLGLVGSESLFLARFGAESLPATFVAASGLTVAGTLAYAAVVGRARNDALFGWMFGGAAVGLAAASFAADDGWVIAGLFCFYYLAQAVFLNHSLTFAVDYFDASASKRLFPRFALSTSLGGIAGGGLAMLLAAALGPASLIGGWALLFGASAGLLRAARRRLRRWGPLELEEADETSVEGMRGALRYLRQSSLGRWLVLSALGMVVSLFVAQYVYSDIFVRTFPDPGDLAAFFGLYLALTNGLEILVGALLTPMLIRRMGVAGANLIHPILTLASFGALAFQYALPAAIAARANREMVENSLSFPIRSLVYNAMPLAVRGRTRAFLEGVVVYAGMSGAGALLLLMSPPDPMWLCAAGAAAALVFLYANGMARREYLRELVGQLRAGRLDLEDLGGEIGDWGAARLALLWEQLLHDEGARPTRSLLELIPALARHGVIEPLVRGASHANPIVREACAQALADVRGAEVDRALGAALSDPEARVRLAALRASAGRSDRALAERVRGLAGDPDPQVRAEAAARTGATGIPVLEAMIASADPAEACAALDVAPPELLASARARAEDADPPIRAAALQALARLGPRAPVTVALAARAVRHTDARVRSAGVALLAGLEGDATPEVLASVLGDPSAEVQRAAERCLAALGESGVEAVQPLLRDERERAVEGALRVLAAGHTPRGRETLAGELRRHARSLWRDLLAYQHVPQGDGLGPRFLRAAYSDSMLRSRRLAFCALECLEGPKIIRRVEKELRFGTTRSRGDALEVLSNLGDRESARLLVTAHEAGSLRERLPDVAPFIPPPKGIEEVLDAARSSELRWIRLGARALEEGGIAPPEEEAMERLLALKQVPLFANLSLEQLEAVGQITRERVYPPNEVIMREGDPGGELFLLIDGKVRAYKSYGTPSQTLLSSLDAGSYFGEMAILDDEPRSATIVAGDETRVLCLDGASLKELILQMPEISFEIFRVLTARLRTVERRLGGTP